MITIISIMYKRVFDEMDHRVLHQKINMELFTPVSASQSGVLISGEVRKIKSISIGKDRRKAVLIAKNNDFLELLIVNKR